MGLSLTAEQFAAWVEDAGDSGLLQAPSRIEQDTNEISTGKKTFFSSNSEVNASAAMVQDSGDWGADFHGTPEQYAFIKAIAKPLAQLGGVDKMIDA